MLEWVREGVLAGRKAHSPRQGAAPTTQPAVHEPTLVRASLATTSSRLAVREPPAAGDSARYTWVGADEEAGWIIEGGRWRVLKLGWQTNVHHWKTT